jgi:hypothetical protein
MYVCMYVCTYCLFHVCTLLYIRVCRNIERRHFATPVKLFTRHLELAVDIESSSQKWSKWVGVVLGGSFLWVFIEVLTDLINLCSRGMGFQAWRVSLFILFLSMLVLAVILPFMVIWEAAALNSMVKQTPRIIAAQQLYTPDERRNLKADIKDTTNYFVFFGMRFDRSHLPRFMVVAFIPILTNTFKYAVASN